MYRRATVALVSAKSSLSIKPSHCRFTGTTTTFIGSNSNSHSPSTTNTVRSYASSPFLSASLSVKTTFNVPDPADHPDKLQLSKIVATIGPTSEQLDPLTEVVRCGMAVMRLNFSHATVEEVELRMTNLEKAEETLTCENSPATQRIRAILLDTRGPEIRTGKLQNDHSGKETVPLEKGEMITLHTSSSIQEQGSTGKDLFIDYPDLHKALSPGMKVLLDDGAVIMTVVESQSDKGPGEGTVTCQIDNTGEIRSRAGVNLPLAETNLPPMSEKDKLDIKYGMTKDIDFVAASFVQNAAGVREIRDHIKKCAEELGFAESYSLPKIISKIESAGALVHFDEILEESDGIMVARGDLGVEIPIQQVTNAQKEMFAACNAVGKPVIVATQLLDSMAKNPRPTRAEVADVTNSIYDGADAVMLSGETAKGRYPSETITMMNEIIRGAEMYSACPNALGSVRARQPVSFSTAVSNTFGGPSPEAAVARAAVTASVELGASAIVVLSNKYHLSQLVSAFRPSVPIITFCSTSKMARQLMLNRAVHPIISPTSPKPEDALETAKAMGYLKAGQLAVLVAVDDEKVLGHTETLKMVEVH